MKLPNRDNFRQSLWVFILSIIKHLFVIFISLDLRPGFALLALKETRKHTIRNIIRYREKRLTYFETLKNSKQVYMVFQSNILHVACRFIYEPFKNEKITLTLTIFIFVVFHLQTRSVYQSDIISAILVQNFCYFRTKAEVLLF